LHFYCWADIPEEFLEAVKSLAEELFTSKSTDIDELKTGFQIIKNFQVCILFDSFS